MLAGNSIMKKFCPDNYGAVLSGLAHICSRRCFKYRGSAN